MTPEELDEHVRQLVATWPPPTAEQIRVINAVLWIEDWPPVATGGAEIVPRAS